MSLPRFGKCCCWAYVWTHAPKEALLGAHELARFLRLVSPYGTRRRRSCLLFFFVLFSQHVLSETIVYINLNSP